MPKNDGDPAPQIERLKYTKVIDLELSNMENSPVYSLKHQLSIGSEIGNIIISDPSVSPRHASFILQQEVVSVIDHGSIAGTKVNGAKISSGKYIILEESDVVNVGDLEIRLKVSTVAGPIDEIPEIPNEDEAEAEAAPVAIAEVPQKQNFDARTYLKNNKKEVKKRVDPKLATNSLVRVFAVLSDVLLSYSLLVILLPFDDVRYFLDSVPSLLVSLFDIDWKGLWTVLNQDYGFLGQMLEDIFEFFSNTFHVGPLFIMFVMTRFISTIVLGVSLSEFMFGVKAGGNVVWARIGGALRVLVGVVTWPFLVFDLPSVISRRTFKEVITFTHTYLSSKFVSILGIIIFLPLMVAFALLSPLMQGFEAPETIIVNDQVEQRVKVKAPTVEGAIVRTKVDRSKVLNLELTYNPDEVSIFPDYQFQGVRNKLNFKTELVFFQKDLQRQVVVEVFKNFDLKQLLGFGMKGNVFLYEKYPNIYNFVYSSPESNPAFKEAVDAKTQVAFGNEVIQFTKMAFELNPMNAMDVMENETLLLKGLIDYKASLLSLIEYKDFDQIGFIKLGNILFMKMSFNKQRPFDLLIPLMKGEGRIFKVNFDKKENLNDLTSKFYKFTLERSNWLPDGGTIETEVMTTFQVLDLFSSPEIRTGSLTPNQAQGLYAYYFETSSAILSRGDKIELDIWLGTVKNLMKLIEALPVKQLMEGEEDPRLKLLQNFRDLSDAIENKNFEYFGITQTV